MIRFDISRRVAIAALAVTFAVAPFAAQTGIAADWPTRPIKIIVPFPPGGPADGSARVLAEAMGPDLGGSMVVENRTGGGGTIGIAAASQSNDGHTLLMGSTSMTVTPAMRNDLPYDIFRDFEPVGMVSSQPLVLVVPANSELKSVEDVIRIGREKKGMLTAANSGVGTLSHLTNELFNIRTGTDITNVPYRGEGAVIPDLLAGGVSMGFLNMPILLPHIQAGKLRALAVTSRKPVAELPGVKTFIDHGLAEFDAEGWAALLASKGMPPEAVARVSVSLRKALASPAVREKLEKFGVTPVSSTPAELTAYLKSESARWGDVVRTRNIKAE